MTLTILCAGALAPPGAQRVALEADPAAAPPGALAATQLRDEIRGTWSTRAAALPDVSAFARRLRRARIVARTRDDDPAPAELPDERWLRECFALDGALPACTLDATAGDALVVRPVHLHLGLDHLVLAPPARSVLDENEARALADTANRWLAEDGLALTPVRADAWRLDVHNDEARAAVAAFGTLRAPSARVASGRNIAAWLPQGEAAARWRAFENLVQMAWHEHPVNQLRALDGRLPITALWLEGRAGAAHRRAFARVLSDDPALRGLAQRAGSAVAAFDTGGPYDDGTLVDAGFWKDTLADGDADAWDEAWIAFDRWFENAATGATPLRLVLTGERECIELAFERSDRFKLWRSLAREALFERAR